MGLQKARIKNVDTGDEMEVKFNPREYTFEKASPWKPHHNQGLDSPDQQWTSGEPLLLHIELFFDVFEEKDKDVREYTDKVEELAHVNPDKHRPPICLITWGKSLKFQCLLTSLSQRFTKFREDGTPVRAICTCIFREYTPPKEQLKAAPRHSADHFKRRVVKQGDTLTWIAGKEYGNPGRWRVIADANKIDDPMHLIPGQELIIPPIL